MLCVVGAFWRYGIDRFGLYDEISAAERPPPAARKRILFVYAYLDAGTGHVYPDANDSVTMKSAFNFFRKRIRCAVSLFGDLARLHLVALDFIHDLAGAERC